MTDAAAYVLLLPFLFVILCIAWIFYRANGGSIEVSLKGLGIELRLSTSPPDQNQTKGDINE